MILWVNYYSFSNLYTAILVFIHPVNLHLAHHYRHANSDVCGRRICDWSINVVPAVLIYLVLISLNLRWVDFEPRKRFHISLCSLSFNQLVNSASFVISKLSINSLRFEIGLHGYCLQSTPGSAFDFCIVRENLIFLILISNLWLRILLGLLS